MKKIVFQVSMIISLNSFATVYEKKNDGIVSFSNIETSGSTSSKSIQTSGKCLKFPK